MAADRLMRAQTDLVINHTTARMPGVSIDQVLHYLRETPEPTDMISLNTGSITFNTPLVNGTRQTVAIPNSYEDIRQTVLICRERGIIPEELTLDIKFFSNVYFLI